MLTQDQIAEIASRHGFETTDSTVVANVEGANKLHGTACKSFNGDMRVHWGCNTSGFYEAENLLDGFLREESRVAEADCDSIGRFHSDAFGDDD